MPKTLKERIFSSISFITKAARTVNITDKYCKDLKFTIGKRKTVKRKPAKRKHIPKAVRDAVMERDNYTCVYCGSTKNPELDHNEAHANNGSNEIDNLQVLCRSCNRRKGVS